MFSRLYTTVLNEHEPVPKKVHGICISVSVSSVRNFAQNIFPFLHKNIPVAMCSKNAPKSFFRKCICPHGIFWAETRFWRTIVGYNFLPSLTLFALPLSSTSRRLSPVIKYGGYYKVWCNWYILPFLIVWFPFSAMKNEEKFINVGRIYTEQNAATFRLHSIRIPKWNE